jgi:hypothetical protein
MSEEWREEERKAMEFRGDHLRIYEVQTDKGECFGLLNADWTGNPNLSPLTQ